MELIIAPQIALPHQIVLSKLGKGTQIIYFNPVSEVPKEWQGEFDEWATAALKTSPNLYKIYNGEKIDKSAYRYRQNFKAKILLAEIESLNEESQSKLITAIKKLKEDELKEAAKAKAEAEKKLQAENKTRAEEDQKSREKSEREKEK